jgi:hypothetical protein
MSSEGDIWIFLHVLQLSIRHTRVMNFRPDSPEFERYELLDEMNQLPQPGPRPAQRCGYAQECLRRFRAENDTLGEGLMILLENAEEIAEEHSVEGYYLKAANHLKNLSVCRTNMFNAFNDFVAHHQRNGVMMDEDDMSPQIVVNMRETIRQIENRNTLLQIQNEQALREMRETRDELMNERGSIGQRMDNLKRSLEAQYKSRYERKEEELLRKIRERDEVILTDGIKLTALRGELQDSNRRAKEAKGLVRFLNIKVREITKKARGRGPPGEPKCHVLGAYDDILGTPV